MTTQPPAMVAHAYNPSTCEAEAGGSPQMTKAILDYIVRPYLENKQTNHYHHNNNKK